MQETSTKAVCLMHINASELLHALKQVSGAVEQSQVMQILSHVLLSSSGSSLSVLASNSEVEVETEANLISPTERPFAITVSCKKLLDICRALPESAVIEFHESSEWLVVKSTDAQFRMATLPADSFPRLPALKEGSSVRMTEKSLKENIESSSFSMAYQDARFFLNGMLFSCNEGKVCCVATDGHRLSWSRVETDQEPLKPIQAILPRKTVLELAKLLRPLDEPLEIVVSEQAVEVRAAHFSLKSNLIEGQYPKYQKLIPSSISDVAVVDRKALKHALDKVAILANEKFKGARFFFENNALKIVSSNFDQEEAVSMIPVSYLGKSRSVAFNINYVLEVLNVIPEEFCKFQFSDTMQGVLVEAPEGDFASYVIMPLTL
ncbi:DNA polymerase III subunit beta [Candidatus Synchoanobacter obligatus]|uniref:Beta sliding clamp n=1 Tax=Candidatus Synchoanobacter obligatus TaxID=2919597 RepID=A0ABT1L4Z1_9GAMM|nr:DNA polymerase III subunit beta [Candidatus Synchoanobacter obligatus]MCP8352241.1 DNA polymerase III subunit beta [Candidatus Synchoanobacter obligatus]